MCTWRSLGGSGGTSGLCLWDVCSVEPAVDWLCTEKSLDKRKLDMSHFWFNFGLESHISTNTEGGPMHNLSL